MLFWAALQGTVTMMHHDPAVIASVLADFQTPSRMLVGLAEGVWVHFHKMWFLVDTLIKVFQP